MSDELEDDQTEQIDAVVDAQSILTGVPEMSTMAFFAFCVDTAQAIHTYAEIAKRYGFADAQTMREFLVNHPVILRKIKELRAVWQSDENLETRLRKLAGHSVLEAMPDTAAIMFDKAVTPGVRLDALKAHSRIAGVDGLPPVGKDGQPVGGSGSKFSVSIVFSGAGKVETMRLAPDPPEIEGEIAQ